MDNRLVSSKLKKDGKTRKKGETPAIPSLKGAYGLLIELTKPFNRKIGAFGFVGLVPGFYLYAGNAYGYGGINGRIRRHLKAKKSLYWHADSLTVFGHIKNILSVPFGQECNLVKIIQSTTDATYPIPNFGSTDCQNCPSHLLFFSTGKTQFLKKIKHQVRGEIYSLPFGF